MKLVDWECTGCEAQDEILLQTLQITPEDLVDDPAAEHIGFDTQGVLRCKECGSVVEISTLKKNRYIWHWNDMPSMDGVVQDRREG